MHSKQTQQVEPGTRHDSSFQRNYIYTALSGLRILAAVAVVCFFCRVFSWHTVIHVYRPSSAMALLLLYVPILLAASLVLDVFVDEPIRKWLERRKGMQKVQSLVAAPVALRGDLWPSPPSVPT